MIVVDQLVKRLRLRSKIVLNRAVYESYILLCHLSFFDTFFKDHRCRWFLTSAPKRKQIVQILDPFLGSEKAKKTG